MHDYEKKILLKSMKYSRYMDVTHEFDFESCKEMLLRKKSEIDDCEKCFIKLDYGDKEGVLTSKNNPQQAGFSRKDTRVGYTNENIQIVCRACQTFSEVDDSEDVYLSNAELSDLKSFLTDKIFEK